VKDGRPLEEIDPAVFKDDDGHVYYYWGQEKAEAARLKTPYELDAESYVDGIIDARRHFFFEGSSMRKRRGVYYYIYCAVIDGKANHLAYATSCSPLGPFQYRGVIIDNQKCDPESWNIHGSIIEIDGQWYVLYHRSSNRGFFSRRACAEKIYFDQDGFIKTVEMTTQGFIGPINAEEQILAAAACEVEGGNYITREADGTHTVVNNTNGCRAEYRYIDFGKTLTGRILRIRAAPHISGTMVVSIDSGKIICKISFSGRHSSQWVDLTTQTCEIAGVHSLRISFESENKNNSLCDFLWFTFIAL